MRSCLICVGRKAASASYLSMHRCWVDFRSVTVNLPLQPGRRGCCETERTHRSSYPQDSCASTQYTPKKNRFRADLCRGEEKCQSTQIAVNRFHHRRGKLPLTGVIVRLKSDLGIRTRLSKGFNVTWKRLSPASDHRCRNNTQLA